jgi:hypothetical protein
MKYRISLNFRSLTATSVSACGFTAQLNEVKDGNHQQAGMNRLFRKPSPSTWGSRRAGGNVTVTSPITSRMSPPANSIHWRIRVGRNQAQISFALTDIHENGT